MKINRRKFLKSASGIFIPAYLSGRLPCSAQFPYSGARWQAPGSSNSPIPSMTEGWKLEENNSADRLAISGINGNRFSPFASLTYDINATGIHNHCCGSGSDGVTGGLSNQNLTMFNTPSGRSFTWSLWFNTSIGVAFNRPILTKFDYTLSPNKDYTLQGSSGTIYWIAEPSAAGGLVQMSIGTVSSGTWYNMIFGYDDTAKQIFAYFNGGSRQSLACNGITNTTTIPVILYQYAPSGSAASAGSTKIDELYFWQRVLTGPEASYLYNGGSGNFA